MANEKFKDKIVKVFGMDDENYEDDYRVPPSEGQAEGVCVIILLVELKGQEAGDGASLEPPHEEEANLIGALP